MNRTLTISGLLVIILCGATACASEPAQSGLPAEVQTDTQHQGSESTAQDSAPEEVSAETTMPSGARPGSSDFPFPVPTDWLELEPFTEEKIGKARAMTASFVFPGDAQSASVAYQKLLNEAGFELHPNPLGEQVNAASFIVKGNISGAQYAGSLDFDTIADGTQRVAINLAED